MSAPGTGPDLSSAELRDDYNNLALDGADDQMQVDIMSTGDGLEPTGGLDSVITDEPEATPIGLHSTITQLRQGSPRSGPPPSSPSPGPLNLAFELTNANHSARAVSEAEALDGDGESVYDQQAPDPLDRAWSSRPPSRGPPDHFDTKQGRSHSPSTSASPFPQAYALGKTNLVPGTRIPLPPLAVLQAPVALYQSLGDDPDDEDGHKPVKRKGKPKAKQPGTIEEHEEEDDRLYCVCESRYDANVDRAMIACDKCENWYHLDCVKIDEDRVHLVDQFICPICAKASVDRTTWKAPCARPECLNAIVPLSKFCSDYCAIEVIAGRLHGKRDKHALLWDKVSGARRVEAAVIDAPSKRPKLELAPTLSAPTPDGAAKPTLQTEHDHSQTLATLNRQLDDSTTKRAAVGLQLGLVESRLRYLRLAVRRWEKLCADFVAASAAAAAVADEAATAPRPKGKAKKQTGGPTSAPEAICGFDVRLVDSDDGWARFVESEEGQQLLALEEPAEGDLGPVDVGPEESYTGVLCMAPRKKCERHKGWQQVRDADFQVEYSAVEARLDRLNQHDVRLRAKIEEHEAGAQFRALYQHRSELDANGRVASAQARESPGGRTKANGTKAGGVNKGGRPRKVAQASLEAQVKAEPIDLPEEVMAVLSRTQQRQMQQLRSER